MIRALALLAVVFLGARAEANVEVDLQLVLAVDVSGSITEGELEIQRRGYAEALADPAVLAAISGGRLGRVAMAYMEWAAADDQELIVDWMLVRNREDAERFVARMQGPHEPRLRLTSISHGIDFAAALFEGNGFESHRKVIDISGDGPSNDGRVVTWARDDAAARGVTINGLQLMTREGEGGQWYLDDLDRYYRDCVIGGPGAFIIPVMRWADFPKAVRQKLLIELSGAPAPVQYASRPRIWRASAGQDDCRYGDPVWGPKEWWDNPQRSN